MSLSFERSSNESSSLDSTYRVYLDYQATTPIDPRVTAAMQHLLDREFGNPHSTGHVFGLAAASEVERAQIEIADCVGAFQQDIIFTSGSTEANNLAIIGFASALTHSDGSGISESFLKIDAADADHWKGFDVLLCALM